LYNKKVLNLLLFSILLVTFLFSNFVSADGLVANTNAPTITLTFDEAVNITGAELYCNEVSTFCDATDSSLISLEDNISLTMSSDNKEAIFSITSRLFNQNYTLHVEAEDMLGNSNTEDIVFLVDAGTFNITLVEPPNGWSYYNDFDVIITTPASAYCWYSTEDFGFDINRPDLFFNSTSSTQHIKYDIAINKLKKVPLDMFVTCVNDSDSTYSWKHFQVAWDNTRPVVHFSADPVKLIDLAEPTIDLIAESKKNYSLNENEDKIGCEYKLINSSLPALFPVDSNYQLFDQIDTINTVNNYSIISTKNLDFSEILQHPNIKYSEHNFTYLLRCRNKAGNFSASSPAEINLTVDFVETFDIVQWKPGRYTRSNNPDLIINTSIKSESCNFIESPENTFTKSESEKTFTYSGLNDVTEEGDYDFDIVCTSKDGQADSNKTIEFTLDKSGPKNLSVTTNEYTCSLNSLDFEMSAEDEISGLDYFNYTISNSSGVIKSGTTSNDEINYDFDIQPNEQYTINVYAYDRAGNAAGPVTASTYGSYDNLTACDNENPIILIDATPESGVTYVNISCLDDKSGCKDTFYVDMLTNLSESCTYSDSGYSFNDPIPVYEPTKLCVKVTDNNNNNATKTILIDIESADHCSNGIQDEDETDVDCGGTECFACDINSSCESNNDCSSGWCYNNVCKVPSCSDSIQNGDETDVDCGGSCQACALNQSCSVNFDCESGFCNDQGVCAESSCSDGVSNGDESGIDCGGSCPPCPNGEDCFFDEDCDSGYCDDSGVCADERDDLESEPEQLPSKDSKLSLILLIIGIIFVVAGIGYLVYDYFMNKDSRQSNDVSFNASNTNKSVPPKVDPQQLANLKKRKELMQKRFKQKSGKIKNKFTSKLDAFEEKTDEIKKQKQDKESKESKKVMGDVNRSSTVKNNSKKPKKKLDEGLSDEYVDIDKLNNKDVPDSSTTNNDVNKKESKGKDVFSELDKINTSKKKEFNKESNNTQKYKEKQDYEGNYISEDGFKQLETLIDENKSKSEYSNKSKDNNNSKKQNKHKLNKDELFDALTNINAKHKEATKSDLPGKGFSSNSLVSMFKNKNLNIDVFKLILSELMKTNKLNKSDVSSIVFNLLEQDAIKKDQANKILTDLNLLNKTEDNEDNEDNKKNEKDKQ
jgi:hypothetical protein